MNWKKVVAGIAPTIAKALMGPLAGTAISFIGKELLGNEEATEADIEKAILTASPELLVKLQEINKAFEIEMKRLGVDLEALALEDRKSARSMAINADLINMIPHIILSAVFIGGYFWLVYMLFSGQVILKDNTRDMANILLGVLTAGIPMIIRFWFGGSPGDDKFLEKIYNSIPQRPFQ